MTNLQIIRKITLEKATKTAHFNRVIGTVDFKGQGTTHTVHDVNPFILMDDPPVLTKAGLPPFPMHPHHKLQVLSLIWSGSMYSKLVSETKETILDGPVVASLFAGRGMAHIEHTYTDDACLMQQLICLIPSNSATKPAQVQVNRTGFFSTSEGSEAFLACGKMFDRDAGITTETPMNVVFGKLAAKSSVTLKTMFGGCFVYVVEGELMLNERTLVPEKTLAILDEGDADLQLQAMLDSKYVFGNGERVEESWVKLLTHSGFLIASDEIEALRQEEIVKKVGLQHYGRQDLLNDEVH